MAKAKANVTAKPKAKVTAKPKVKPVKAPKPVPPAIPVAFDVLTSLLGKPAKDPAVVEVLATAGKVVASSDFLEAKEAGFDFSLDVPVGAAGRPKKVLSSLFLFPSGKDGHRGYADLPAGFRFTTRAELIATAGEPATSWKIGKGKVPSSTSGVAWDEWGTGGLRISANYAGDGSVGHYNVTLPEAAVGGRDLATHPLHFATKPADAPAHAELIGMALLVAWAADRFGLPAKHAGSALGRQLAARAITPRTFLIEACARTLTTLDVAPQLGDFLWTYTNLPLDDAAARKGASKRIAALLRLEAADDRRSFNDDFLGTFRDVTSSPFHVPDHWDAVDRIGPILDARLADFQATAFTKAPDLARYERAARDRDARAVTPTRTELAAMVADDALADELVGLIGRPLKDPAVKAVLGRAGLPIGKRIDQQANPALGVAYMVTNLPIDGKKQLGVDAVTFFAAKQTSYIRGLGTEIEFAGYPGRLPHGLTLGDARAAVAARLGKPPRTYETHDYWSPTKNRSLACMFTRGVLVEVHIGLQKRAER